MSPVPKRPRPGSGAGGDMLAAVLQEDRDREPEGPADPPPAVDDQEAPAEPPAAALPAQRQEAGRPARTRRATAPARRAGGVAALAGIPMPANLDEGTTRPLNVRVPGNLHFALKLCTTAQGVAMEDIVKSMVSVYLHDPDLILRLIRQADEDGHTLGEITHEALSAMGA